MRNLTLIALLSGTPAFADAYTVSDGLGREIALDAVPQRIVALYNDSYGHLASLGVVPVGVLANPEMLADTATYLPEGPSIPTVGNADGNPDAELIAALDPDLIFAWSQDEVALFDGIAPVFLMDGYYDPGPEAYAGLRGVAAALQMSDKAEAIIAAFDDRVAAYAALVPERPTVLKMSYSGDGSFWFGTESDPVCPLLDRIVTCEWSTSNPQWGEQGTLELALAYDADVILLNNWSDVPTEAFMAEMEANPLWSELRAVQDGRVIYDPDYSNPIFSSIAAGRKFIDTVIPAIFPETFPAPLTDAEVAAALAE